MSEPNSQPASVPEDAAKSLSTQTVTSTTEPEDGVPATPWGMIKLGLGCIVVGAVLFGILSLAENTERSVRLPAFIVLIYELSGKWVTSGLVAAMGLLLTGMGIRNLFRGKDAAEPSKPATN